MNGKLKFKKVYKAPGYPVDPKAEEARHIESYVNAMTGASVLPWRARQYDYESLNRWLQEALN